MPTINDEKARLKSLHQLGLLDTDSEERFDRITKTASLIFDTPISTLTLVDQSREWFKSVCGLEGREGSRAASFCSHAILSDEVMVVPDTHKNKLFSKNPAVVGPPYIRFYAGTPLHGPDGQRIGVLCIKDTEPHNFTPKQIKILKEFGQWAELELNNTQLKDAYSSLEFSYEKANLVAEMASKLTSDRSKSEVLQTVVDTVGNDLKLSRVYIFEDNKLTGTTSNTHEWCSPSTKPQIELLQNVPYAQLPSFKSLLDARGLIIASDIKGLPTDLYKILAPQNIKSIIILPIKVKGKRIGFIGFDECEVTRNWSRSEITFLKTIGSVLSNYYQRQYAIKQLQSSEERKKYIIEGTNVGTWEWNIETGETIFNETWAEIIGYELKELQPTNIDTWAGLTHPDDLKHSDELIEKHFSGELEYYECEARMKHKNGDWIWILDRGKVFEWDENGKPLKMYGTHQNITEEKDIEKSKDEFLSVASHQLLTPLSSINWSLELIIDDQVGKLEQDTKKMLKNIYGVSVRMVDLVNTLLNMSRIELGTIRVEKIECDFKDLLKKHIADLETDAKKKNIQIEVSSKAVPGKLMLDKNLIGIILQNLVSNAIKYSRSNGKVTVSTKIVKGIQRRPSLRIIVNDQGYGIPKRQQKLIFQKFFRANNAVATANGNGLGLYLVKLAVNILGGTITFKSTTKKGSTFYVNLPLI